MSGRCITPFIAVVVVMAVLRIAAADHASGNSDAAHEDAAQRLLSERCRTCHELTTVTARRAPAEEWHAIVDRMVTYGAQVSEDEAETLVAYLAARFGPASQ